MPPEFQALVAGVLVGLSLSFWGVRAWKRWGIPWVAGQLLKHGFVKQAMKLRGQKQKSGCGSC